MTRSQSGFTLVELSIVLVILGLLVGGVLTGQSLIRAAELRAVMTEKSRIHAALYTFRDKYFALPGDMANAFQFWGAGCGTNTTTASTGCNGDGAGTITVAYGENIKVWEHLTLAGLLEGTYDGITVVTGPGNTLTTTNIYKSKLPQSNWDVTDYGYYVAGSPPTSGWANMSIGQAAGDVVLSPAPSLSNSEAWNIDKKLDDGLANTGAVRGYVQGGYACSDLGADFYSIVSQGADRRGVCRLTFPLN